jgi:uncharacterized membrane protein
LDSDLDRADSSRLAVPAGVSAPSDDGLRQARPPQSGGLPTSAPAPAPKRPRLDAVDWLRGLAVLLMIQTHLYDAWCNKAAKATVAYGWTRFIGGIPSRLFLLLVGVSMAIRFERQLAARVDRATMVRTAAKRGLEVIALGYLFRFQEYVLGGFWDWHDLYRVDILNCIGASMVVGAFITAPWRGRPAVLFTALAAAAVIGLGPIVGPMHFPSYLPRPLTSYLGGERPMAWFPLFPSLAWPLVGVLIGHCWVRASGDARKQALTFVITGLVGILLMRAVVLVRAYNPYIIRYPSELVQQMGPGTFFYRLGQIGPLALLAYVVTRIFPRHWFSLMRLFGQTSLLVYWVHVELVYGLLLGRLHHRLSMWGATVGLILMTAAMGVLGKLRLKYWHGWRKISVPKPAGNLPAPLGPL